jgi:hypothetical protein
VHFQLNPVTNIKCNDELSQVPSTYDYAVKVYGGGGGNGAKLHTLLLMAQLG